MTFIVIICGTRRDHDGSGEGGIRTLGCPSCRPAQTSHLQLKVTLFLPLPAAARLARGGAFKETIGSGVRVNLLAGLFGEIQNLARAAALRITGSISDNASQKGNSAWEVSYTLCYS